MAIGATNNNVPTQAENPWLHTLVSDGKWANQGGGTGPVNITYSLRSGESGEEGLVGNTWRSFEISALERALQSWADVANITFTKVSPNNTSANLQQWVGNLGEDGTLGWHEMPNSELNALNGAYNNKSSDWNAKGLQIGSYNYITFIHEIGHALGLRHPHADGAEDPAFPGVDNDQDMGNHKLNQGIFTLMSYVDGWRDRFPNHENPNFGWTGTPMALDIAAIQAIYGANMNHKTGSDTYSMPTSNKAGTYWSCIWDAGGTDTISAANARSNCTIDLREATLTGANAGGFVSWVDGIVGGFTIAKGAIIENAIGGGGNDRITGNAANNSLNGGAGNDTINGRGGDDWINGGAGTDTMTGGGGNDTFVMSNARDVIRESANGGNDTVRAGFTFTLTESSHLENLTLTGSKVANGFGNSANNVMTGNAANNILSGRGGDDRLGGGLGNDELRGGGGNDSFVFDTAAGPNNMDRITDFLSGSDKILLDDLVYSALGETFDVAEFFLGAAAAEAGHRIIYNQETGGLLYDADGVGEGAAVQFALLVNRSTLSHGDFVII